MEMISPDVYIKNKENLTIEELVQEKELLNSKIEKINDDIKNGVPDILNGGRDTKKKIYEEYLQKLEKLIMNKSNK